MKREKGNESIESAGSKRQRQDQILAFTEDMAKIEASLNDGESQKAEGDDAGQSSESNPAPNQIGRNDQRTSLRLWDNEALPSLQRRVGLHSQPPYDYVGTEVDGRLWMTYKEKRTPRVGNSFQVVELPCPPKQSNHTHDGRSM